MATVNCSGCGGSIEVPERHAQPFIKCNGCGRWEKVPARSAREGSGGAGAGTKAGASRTVPGGQAGIIERYHHSRSLEAIEACIAAARMGGLSTDPARQQVMLQALRYTLWHKRGADYGRLIMGCVMGEREIIERKAFFLRLATMLARHVTLVPKVAAITEVGYLAEDMIDGGETELVAAGRRLQTAIDHAGKEGVAGRVCMPPLASFSPEQLQLFVDSPKTLIAQALEPNWEYDSNKTYATAVAGEMLEVAREDVSDTALLLLPAGETYERYFCNFALVTANLLAAAGHLEWVPLIGAAFAGLCGDMHAVLQRRCAELTGSPGADGATGDSGSALPAELELGSISQVWRRAGVDAALPLARARLRLTPDDYAIHGMLSQLHAAKMHLRPALACIVRAFQFVPDNALVLHHLALTFQLGYFAEQVDLCMARLQTLPEYHANPQRYALPVELFLKCDGEGGHVAVDDHPVGACPVRLGQVPPGRHTIVWTLPDGGKKQFVVDLVGGTVAKFRWHPDSGEVSDEISRDGAVTVFTAAGPRDLRDEVGPYLVADLHDLPQPTLEECLDE